LISAAFVLKAVLTASIARKESRGSFIRKDFPQQDDLNWRKNSSLTYEWEREIFSLNHYPSG
jgi:succinate dehydrogenase/fumarate reductase flavoprotein subunit